MKILQVMAGAKRGGAEAAFVDMCIALHEAGETIEVATRANDIRVPMLEQAGIKVHTLPFGGKIDVFTPWRLGKIIRQFKPDIVQTWMARAADKVPRWHASMNVPRYLIVSRLGGYYKTKYFRQTDYFTTITPIIREYLIREGIAPDRVRHINNFAETETAPVPINRAAEGVPAGATLLLALGRLHECKAFDTLIKVVAPLENICLWIAGEGPERAALTKLIADLGVKKRVRLLGWRSDRAALLQAADICMFPSRYEPFGTVFVQAWAQKTPLIASDADGPRQFVRPGEDGLIVKIDDIEGFTAAIARLAGDRDLRQKLAENGYIRYQREFTKEQTLRNYLEWYYEIRAREGL